MAAGLSLGAAVGVRHLLALRMREQATNAALLPWGNHWFSLLTNLGGIIPCTESLVQNVKRIQTVTEIPHTAAVQICFFPLLSTRLPMTRFTALIRKLDKLWGCQVASVHAVSSVQRTVGTASLHRASRGLLLKIHVSSRLLILLSRLMPRGD